MNTFCKGILPLILALAPAAHGRVARVVVYPDRAQVTRVESTSCGPRVVVTFRALPSALDISSLRAATSLGRIEGLRGEARVREAAPAAKRLLDEIRREEGRLRALADRQARSEALGRVAAQYGDVAQGLIGREMSEPPNLRAWAAALDGVQAARLRARAEQADLGAQRRTMERHLGELRAQLAPLSDAARRREHEAEVMVSCPEGKHADVELTYLLGGASFSPAYEARAGDGTVDLTTYATVTQTTGEDWRGARLVLSTAVPRQNATPPTVAPLRVGAQEREPPRRVLLSRQEREEHPEAPGQQPSGSAGGRVRIAAQGLSVQLLVPEPVDVLGDGTPVRLRVARVGLRAPLRYRSAPKLLPHVFRVADLTNTAPYPLLPGPIDVFRRGQFAGRYDLDRVASGERFSLGLGIEEGVKVKRVIIEELARERGLLGSTIRHRYGYRFEIENFLGRPEEVELAEHVPVSELSDVKVAIDGKSSPGYELKAAEGIVTWRLRLQQGERRAVELRYFVDVPSSYEGGG